MGNENTEPVWFWHRLRLWNRQGELSEKARKLSAGSPPLREAPRRQLRERLRDLRAVELEDRTCLLTAEEYANIRKSILQAIAELRTVRGAE